MSIRGRHADLARGPSNVDDTRATGVDALDTPLGESLDEDLGSQLEALASRRIVNRLTLVLAAAALLTGGFLAGAQVQKEYGSTSSTATAPSQRGNFPGGAFANGGARPGASGAAGAGIAGQQQNGAGTTGGTLTTGRIKMVDGGTVYLETSDGKTITVKTDGSTAVLTAQAGTLADLAAGATVTVEGTGSGTTITATKVTKVP